MRHVGLGSPAKPAQPRVLLGLGIIAAAALVAIALQSFQYFVFAFVILAINTFVELHKYFTYGIPIDLELLTVGVAYLGAHGAFVPALMLVIFGPVIADLARGRLTRAAAIRPVVLLAVLLVAPVFGPSTGGLLLSCLVGVAATFIRVMLTARFYWLYTFLARVTQIALHAYVIFFVLPAL